MARKPRLHYPGACYHVILCGNGGNNIFIDKKDRSRFFFLIQEGIERYRYCIHAYCLMTNHVHLVIQVGIVPLSRIIQNISFRYTRYMNQRKNQVGHLFQGRYKALLIDADSYLLELVRYVHNNPVRAGMAKTADEYSWSSHRAYLGEESIPWLTTDFVLSQFSEQKKQAIILYHDFVLKGKSEGHRKEFYQGDVEGRILGEDCFVEAALVRSAQQVTNKTSVEQVIQVVCEQYGISEEALASGSREKRVTEPRAVAALIVRETDHLSLTDLSRKLKRDLSGLSQAATRLEKKKETDKVLSEKLNSMNELIGNTH